MMRRKMKTLEVMMITIADNNDRVSSLGARRNLKFIFESKGKVDCMILAPGKVFL